MAVEVESYLDFLVKFEEIKRHSDLFAFMLFDERRSHKPVEEFVKAEFFWLDKLARRAEIFFFVFFENPAGFKWSYKEEVYLSGPEPRAHLLDLLAEHFNEAEIIDISFRLGVEYEDLPGQGRKSKILQLVKVCERNVRLQELIILADRQRPYVDWPILSNQTDTPIEAWDAKLDRASINQRPNNPSLDVANLFGIRPNELPGIVLFTLSEDGKGVRSGVYLPLQASLFETDIARIENAIADMCDIIIDSRKTASTPQMLLENVSLGIERLKAENNPRPFISVIKQRILSLSMLPKADQVETIFLTEQFGRYFDARVTAYP